MYEIRNSKVNKMVTIPINLNRSIGRTDAEAETLILWPPDTKNQLIGKDPGWERLKAGGEGDNRE